MKTLSITTLAFILIIFSCCCSWPSSAEDGNQHFVQCLFHEFKNYTSISSVVYTPANSSYTSILQSSIRNLRFESESVPKPQAIITPDHESKIPPVIYCAKQSGLEIRTRSGGHDYEGLSYVSHVPFVIIDLTNLSEITVDAEKKIAWVGAGATLGSLYYRIAEKSSILGFPAGLCPTVGVGGHFSGGGYGTMMRKYGLAADNIIDARIVDVSERVLDRESMDKDLFWAIRGGGGASFGVIVAWKVQLVDVPERVTVFLVDRALEHDAIQLVHRWQDIAPRIDHNLNIDVSLNRVNASFFALFLGGVDKLLAMMHQSFPELGILKQDCSEMSWIQSALYFAQMSTSLPNQLASIQDLLNRTMPSTTSFKIKSDYVQKAIPLIGLQGIVRLLQEPDAIDRVIIMVPYGGKMAEIPESIIPFPHRKGNLYKIASMIDWSDGEVENSKRYLSWSRRYYSYMTPYVSKLPRAAYFNYRDLDLGVNNLRGKTSYAQASVWGRKYFKGNFDRLARVKTLIDPGNFFKNEQSIPPKY